MSRPKNDLPLCTKSPSPFKKPFLVLHLSPGLDEKDSMVIDVDGRINLYIHGLLGGDDRTSDATPLMKKLAQELKARNIPVYGISINKDPSAHPTHILRNGVLFKRMSFACVNWDWCAPTWMST
jgi:hypothetical protein